MGKFLRHLAEDCRRVALIKIVDPRTEIAEWVEWLANSM
jgi:hypothetical protein